MDLKQLEYIVKIADENNITHAAEKLFITQSALNQQLLKLEKELGTELFHRSRTNWRPTEAGEIYLATARQMLRMKQDTYNRIFDLGHQRKGTLTIGFTPNRGSSMFSAVYPLFHRKYPHIIVEPLELSVSEQLDAISSHTLDIGFLTLDPNQKKTGVSYFPIKTEEIFLAVPASHDYSSFSTAAASHDYDSLSGTAVSSLPLLSLSCLKGESFVLLYKKSTIRGIIDTLFQKGGFSPNVLFETSRTDTILNMIEANLCCGLIPAYYMQPGTSAIRYYALPEHPIWEIVACADNTSYLSEAAKDFIALAKAHWMAD